LQLVFVQIPNESQFRNLASRFKQVHSIPYIIGATDGSHIPALASVISGEDYNYCRKSFHSTILQRIVGPDFMLWHYEFGIGSLHNWAIFEVTRIRQACTEGKFQPYKYVGDVSYSVRPWMYCLFKGIKVALFGKEAN